MAVEARMSEISLAIALEVMLFSFDLARADKAGDRVIRRASKRATL